MNYKEILMFCSGVFLVVNIFFGSAYLWLHFAGVIK